jgi:hypothetical protein
MKRIRGRKVKNNRGHERRKTRHFSLPYKYQLTDGSKGTSSFGIKTSGCLPKLSQVYTWIQDENSEIKSIVFLSCIECRGGKINVK